MIIEIKKRLMANLFMRFCMGKQWSVLKSHTVKYIIKIHFYYSYLLLLLLLLLLFLSYRCSLKTCLNRRISCVFFS